MLIISHELPDGGDAADSQITPRVARLSMVVLKII